jgi:HPt (histidine-containing phosphotransfer) domain-containing protein
VISDDDEKPPAPRQLPPQPPNAPRSKAATALLPKFIGHRQRDAVDIRAALERGDYQTISRLGHNMRGNGASYGFPDLGTLGERLETAAHQRNEGEVRTQLASLDEWIERVGSTLVAH